MAGFPGTGEDARIGGAGISHVGPPAAPHFSLRDVMRPFDMAQAADRAADGIPTAVMLDDTTGTFAFDRAQCLPDDFAGKEPEPDATYWDFHASGCYVPVGCDRNAHAFDRWWQRARAKVEAASVKRMALRLWFDSISAGTGYANPSLMSVAAQSGHDLSGPSTLDPSAAVATLVQGYFDATDTPGDAVLHVPPIVAVDLTSKGVLKVVNGRLFGPLDVAVTCGPYPSQVGLDGADIGDVALTYVAISGTIYAEEGQTQGAHGDAVAPVYMANERRNEFGVIAERRFIAAFDPGPVFAAQCYVPNIPQAV